MLSSSTPSDKALRKYEHKINLGNYTAKPDSDPDPGSTHINPTQQQLLNQKNRQTLGLY